MLAGSEPSDFFVLSGLVAWAESAASPQHAALYREVEAALEALGLAEAERLGVWRTRRWKAPTQISE